MRALHPPPPARPIAVVVPSGYRAPAVSAMLDVLGDVSADWAAARVVPGESLALA